MVGELSVESQAIDHGWTQMNTDYFNCGAPGLGETSAELPAGVKRRRACRAEVKRRRAACAFAVLAPSR